MTRSKHIVCICILFCFAAVKLHASFSLHSVENLRSHLSNNAILCMHQDQYGFMWFGTYDGLNLYNGKNVDTFRFEFDNPNSLSGNSIYSITNAEDSYLWIGTQLGLDKFSLKERIVVESFPEYKKNETIACDTQGNAWLISKENSLSYYSIKHKIFTNIPDQGRNVQNVREIYVNQSGVLCIIKSDGLIKMLEVTEKENTGAGIEYELHWREKRLHEKGIYKAYYKDDTIFFVDDEMVLYTYDTHKQQKMLIKNISKLIFNYGNLSDIVFFHSDVYLAFTHSGMIKLDLSKQYAPEAINIDNGIFCILKDKNQDALWVGTDGQGIELYYSEKDKFYSIMLENLPFVAKKPIRTFYTDEENTLWYGTDRKSVV